MNLSIDRFDKMEERPEEVRTCQIDAVLTGSRVYGPRNLKSDIDLVINEEDAMSLANQLEAQGIKVFRTLEQDNYDAGFYFLLGPLSFNVIFAWNKDDLLAWAEVTEEMKKLDPIENREKRIEKFQELYQERR